MLSLIYSLFAETFLVDRNWFCAALINPLVFFVSPTLLSHLLVFIISAFLILCPYRSCRVFLSGRFYIDLVFISGERLRILTLRPVAWVQCCIIFWFNILTLAELFYHGRWLVGFIPPASGEVRRWPSGGFIRHSSPCCFSWLVVAKKKKKKN